MNDGSFLFGVEIELFLGSRKQKNPTFKSLAEEVNKRLTKAGIANHIKASNDKSASKYRKWSLVQEVSIPPSHDHYGIELVSPIYPATATSRWQSDLTTIFATLHKHFLIAPSPKCSTHIHLSGTPVPLSAGELAALAKTVLYFEPALDRLMPAGRRSNSESYWCQSNRCSPPLAGLSPGECLARLDEAAATPGSGDAGVERVVECMNLVSADSPLGRVRRMQAHESFLHGKVYKWNFTGVMPGGGGTGTVEFRQPGGCVTAGEATAWIVLTLAFAVGAMSVGPGLGEGGVWPGAGESLDELKWVLEIGREALGWGELVGVGELFARAETEGMY